MLEPRRVRGMVIYMLVAATRRSIAVADTIVGGLSELDSIPYPRYRSSTILADQNGHNGS